MGLATSPSTRSLGQESGWSQSTPLLAGDAGTSQTIDLIRKAVWQGLQDARVRAQLAQILQGVPAYDTRGEAQAIFAWAVRHIRFTNDPIGHETISTASWTLANRIGDCDDINAVLIPTLLMTAGIPARLVTVSNDPADLSRFSHVYAEAEIGGRWIPLDAARPGARFGATVSQYQRKRLWSLVDRKYEDLAGLAGAHGKTGMGFNWDVFGKAVQGAGQGISEVLSTIFRPAPTLSTVPYGPPIPYGTPGYTAPPEGTAGISTGTVVLVLGGLGALMLMKQK